ncbi:hypothetical protein CW748_16345 [Alteromonadales bacterium alter-6D02]|nr:hypothetical protein CW748_16345 [Alteromonadales bacterium alter-6D02]
MSQSKDKTTNQESVLSNMMMSDSALTQAYLTQQRVAQYGFDWPSWHGVLEKVKEEVEEVNNELEADVIDLCKVKDEIGDLLFAVVNLARNQGLDPETVLSEATKKFTNRFLQVEALLHREDSNIKQANLSEMEQAWQKVKLNELECD